MGLIIELYDPFESREFSQASRKRGSQRNWKPNVDILLLARRWRASCAITGELSPEARSNPRLTARKEKKDPPSQGTEFS